MTYSVCDRSHILNKTLLRLAVWIFSIFTINHAHGQSAKSFYDSAVHAFEYSQSTNARQWIERSLSASSSNEDRAHNYVLLGTLEEQEGYVNRSERAYRQALKLSSRSMKEAAISLNGIASVHVNLSQLDSVITWLDQSRKLDPSRENKLAIDVVVGRYWIAKNQYDKALSQLQVANDEAIALRDKRTQAFIVSHIGNVHFSHTPDMHVALDFFSQSNALLDSSRNAFMIARNYGRMANAHMVLGNQAEAARLLNNALRIAELSGNLHVMSYILSSQATLLAEQGKTREAIAYAQKPLNMKRELGQTRQLQNDLLNLGEMYTNVNEYEKARAAFREGIEVSKALHDIVYLKYFYNGQAILDSLTGNYRNAFSNIRKSFVYQDSVFSLDRLNAVQEIAEKYEAEQKEKIIAEKELVIEQQKLQQVLMGGGILFALLIFIVVLIVIRNRNRVKLEHERAHQDRIRLETIVNTQEEVQQRIARDLHDGLVQVLGAAKISLQSIPPGSDEQIIRERIKNASHIMDDAVTEARTISHDLLPYSLLRDGLISAMDELFTRSLSHYTFNKNATADLLTSTEAVNIYRIAQELVNNTLKYAGDGVVTASWSFTNKIYYFRFADNGKGFSNSLIQHGAGLMNMTTRAELIGATLHIASSEESGVVAELALPK